MRISVCALTYRRPDGLARLLEGLADLELDEAWQIEFVIVDNDPDASGQAHCEEVDRSGRLGGKLRYVNQPIQGIARSRNAALDAAPESELIAFLDDDESPNPDWLSRLVEAIDHFDADVVGGPVLPVIEGNPPAWIVEGGFFDRRRYESGTALGHVFTNNVLFRGARQRELGIRFDERPRFAELRVGEDRLFFQAFRMAGARTVWCDDAIVREWIPGDRADETWLVERMRKIGLATAVVERELDSSASRRFWLLAKAIIWWGIGAARSLVTLGDPIKRTRARRARAYARGLLAGLSA